MPLQDKAKVNKNILFQMLLKFKINIVFSSIIKMHFNGSW